MKYTKEENKAIENFKYWIQTNTERGVCTIPDYICLNALNLLEKQQKEIEKYKRIAEMNLKDGEEFKNEMCEHRCILKSDLEENYIPKALIKEKIDNCKFFIPEYGGEFIAIENLKELFGRF